jgi:DNA-binding HxlR family transcriptional regulator
VVQREATDRGFKARAGALALFYIVSPMERDVLLTMLAEANTGLKLQEIEPPDPEFLSLGVFQDPYLLEPADPHHPPGVPIDENTMLKATPAGREVPVVAAVLDRWLRRYPGGKMSLTEDTGLVLGPLLTGWSSMAVHALAGGPRSAAEVQRTIQTLELDMVERRLEEMVAAALLEQEPGPEAEPRYAVTNFLRQAVAPLAAAVRMEHRYPPGDTAPLTALDVEAIFQLALPLLKLPGKLSGVCSLAVELDEGVPESPARVTARIEAGRLVGCEPGLDQRADARVTGSVADWLDTLLERKVERVRSGGDVKLARRLVRELRRSAFS